MGTITLFPEHMSDLRKSGLDQETIEAAGVFSIGRDKIPEVIGWPMPVNSLLAFPYPGKDFTRYKLFPTYHKNSEKRAMKYFQPKGSGLHLYEPPSFDQDNRIIRITEGEKKALKATAENLNCCGLGGIWNFADRDQLGVPELIEDLAVINWKGREVEIIPDPDFLINEHVLPAVFRLGRILTLHGAKLRVVKLPDPLKLDDFLTMHPVSEFYKLERLILENTVFDSVREKEVCRDAHLTDLGLAKRFTGFHGHQVRYCYPWKSWLIWTGIRWERDDRGEVERLMKATVARVYGEAAKSSNEERRKAIAKFALTSESEAKRKAAIATAQSEPGIPIMPDEMDRDKFLLNVMNGILNLRLGRLLPHDPEYLITKLAPVFFQPDATCPTWLNFLNRIMQGNPRLIAYLQKAVGYSLTGSTVEQILQFLYGLGANGKTTFIDIIMIMLGDYAVQTTTETLMVKKNSGIPNDLAALKGARFVAAQEVESGQRLSESLIKQLTGGDRISARFLHAEFFEFKPQFKLWMSGNSRPIIRGGDHGIWRRMKEIPFTVQIPPEEQDRKLSEKLRGELPGIFNWALDGCLAWQKEGRLIPPDEVMAATENYRSEMDILGQFIEDRCLTGPGFQVSAKELYGAYVDWSESQGERRPMSQQFFGMRIVERGFERGRQTGGAVRYKGLGLRASEGSERP